VSNPGRSGPAPTTKTIPCAATYASSTTDLPRKRCTLSQQQCTRDDTRTHPVGASGPSLECSVTLRCEQIAFVKQPCVQQRQREERRHQRDHHVRRHRRRTRLEQHGHRVHCSEEVHAEVYERHQQRPQNSQHSRKSRTHLEIVDRATQNDVARVDEPEKQRQCQARVPCPVRPPYRLRPERPGHEYDGREDEPDFSRARGNAIELGVLEPQVEHARNENEPECQIQPNPGGWRMNVKNLLCRTLQSVERREEDRADVHADHGENRDYSKFRELHCSSVYGYSRVQTTRNTTSNAPRIEMYPETSDTARPFMSRAVACAAGRITGTKNGSASNGSSSSASRVLTAIEENNVPTATSPTDASSTTPTSGQMYAPIGTLYSSATAGSDIACTSMTNARFAVSLPR